MVSRTESISGELLKLKEEIKAYALDYGLDFYPVIYEVCDYDTMMILAAQGGFPSRYPHWRFGMEYDQLSKNYTYGLQKIYEMVINTDPCYAYLLKSNHYVDQKIVMAHVYGHADFFKNNYWFKSTDRKMMDGMANHATKIRRYMDKYGADEVESFIDKVYSIENLLNINDLFSTPDIKRKGHEEGAEFDEDEGKSQALRSFIQSKKRRQKEKESKVEKKEADVLPPTPLDLPQRDIMRFIGEHAPLEEWQADIIGILRDEAYYFLPQRLTKIMNEGWASYWHSKILTQKALKSSELIDFADKHSGVMQMSRKQINPYKIGIELYRDIEYRWDTGKFGKEYNDCEDLTTRENWDLKLMQGRDKIFEVRKSHNDVTFIDEFLTPEFCERQNIFTYKYNPRTGRGEIDTRDFEAIKQKLLSQITNFGTPAMEVENSNYKNRGELLVAHVHHGVDLDMSYAQDTLRNLFALWKRPVNLATRYEDKGVIFHFDGKEMKPIS